MVDAQAADVHVVLTERDGEMVWAVLRTGATRASRVYPSRLDAIAVARRISRRDHAALYIEQSDGTIKQQSAGPARHYTSHAETTPRPGTPAGPPGDAA
ncbi:DUF2188 domain-containing protein [Tenggerimyces flavus]|uniref:DUF2188 domain-containing protein n=1 Tax=Tenggerimyces flavus TaxID=1708749 RepID=A0ABV7YB42_9ACTN|nr:DUF2188 domain-containing protein [Tenggerimyces flavus]MBM7790286.1 hypothetical protein [Tenggerimyces flavus]